MTATQLGFCPHFSGRLGLTLTCKRSKCNRVYTFSVASIQTAYCTCAIITCSHCSRVTRYNSFISQDLFHFPMLIHDGDTLNSPLNLKINGRILKNSNFFTYWKIFSEIYVLIYKTVAILIKLGINIVRICKESQHWSKNLWIKPD